MRLLPMTSMPGTYKGVRPWDMGEPELALAQALAQIAMQLLGLHVTVMGFEIVGNNPQCWLTNPNPPAPSHPHAQPAPQLQEAADMAHPARHELSSLLHAWCIYPPT